MAIDNFVGEIILVPYNFAPENFAFCNGQLLWIAQNTTIVSLLGTTFGGDHMRTFGLPNLRGRIGLSSGRGPGLDLYNLGDFGGQESVSLNVNQLPSHNHGANAVSSAGSTATPREHRGLGHVSRTDGIYQNATAGVGMNALGGTGGSRAMRIGLPSSCSTTALLWRGSFPPEVDRVAIAGRLDEFIASPSWPRDPETAIVSTPFLGEIILVAFDSPRWVTLSARGRLCGSRGTPRSSRCWARRTAATGDRPSRCQPPGPGAGPVPVRARD